MNLLRSLLLLIIFSGCYQLSIAQNGTISGTLTDGSNPLPGATILIQDTEKGAITDFDGHFVISNIPSGATKIVFSYIGYTTKLLDVVVEPKATQTLGTIVLEESSQALNEIVISGGTRRNSEARALSIQKNGLAMMNVIAADGIGKLPDRNAAETVQRIQGVSIERDQGEGRFVSVRGLPPFWASTTINGNRLPTAEEETTTRATAFDFFPSEMIAYVQAAKAITPDMESDGIGGSVNFITQTPPSKESLSLTLGSGTNVKAGKGNYNAAFTYGNRTEDGKFGYLLNFSHWNRSWATDNFEARRKGDEGVFRLELRDYTGVRETTGINTAIDYKLDDNNKFIVRGTYGTLTDEETHYKHRIRFDKYDEADGTARVELQNIHDELITQLVGFDVGGAHKLANGAGKLDWNIASYENQFKYGNIPNAADNSYFVLKFNQSGVGIKPEYAVSRPDGADDHRAYWKADGGPLDFSNPTSIFDVFSTPDFQLDPTQQKLASDGLNFYKVFISEKDRIVATANYEHTLNDKIKLKVGAKYRNKNRTAEYGDYFFGFNREVALSDLSGNLIDQPGKGDYLSELAGNASNSFGSVLSTQGMSDFYNLNQGGFTFIPEDSDALASGGGLSRNFIVDENQLAGYAMATAALTENLTLIGGLRVENTKTDVNGYSYNEDTAQLSKAENSKNYTAVLPMLHAKYALNSSSNLRAAITRTYSRPNFGDISPGVSFTEADNETQGGNPNLEPTFSLNGDLLYEYYFSNVGVLNAGLFYKRLSNPVFSSTTIIDGVETRRPENGGEAYIAGLELGANVRFDVFTEAKFIKNLGVQTNATFMDSEMIIPNGDENGNDRVVTIPYQAKSLYNFQLYYETDKVNVRAAFNRKGKYVVDFGDKDINDEYYGKYATLDLSGSYNLTKNISVFADLNNVLNEPLIYHYGEDDTARPKQVEYYGIKGSLGFKYSF